MSLMREETLASADCADAFLAQGMALALQCGATLRTRGVRHLEVLGRGSSSHAGTLLRYAIAAQGGLGVSASMPSLAAEAQALTHLRGDALVAISQSGKSPDLVRYARAARDAGAFVVALTNTGGSALGAGADVEIALGAGPETPRSRFGVDHDGLDEERVDVEVVVVLRVRDGRAQRLGNEARSFLVREIEDRERVFHALATHHVGDEAALARRDRLVTGDGFYFHDIHPSLLLRVRLARGDETADLPARAPDCPAPGSVKVRPV